jgi:hypothetical protein
VVHGLLMLISPLRHSRGGAQRKQPVHTGIVVNNFNFNFTRTHTHTHLTNLQTRWPPHRRRGGRGRIHLPQKPSLTNVQITHKHEIEIEFAYNMYRMIRLLSLGLPNYAFQETYKPRLVGCPPKINLSKGCWEVLLPPPMGVCRGWWWQRVTRGVRRRSVRRCGVWTCEI